MGRFGRSTIAVNDVAVHKGGVARVVRVNVFIQGENVGPYSADGIIVATPTGSTAYSLSAGGPIVVPGVEAMVVTPIAAHTLAVRPLVVPATYRIVIEPMEGWSEDLLVSFDGQTGSALAPGESVDVRRADHRVCLIRLGGDGFFGRMRQKLHWGDLSGRRRPGDVVRGRGCDVGPLGGTSAAEPEFARRELGREGPSLVECTLSSHTRSRARGT